MRTLVLTILILNSFLPAFGQKEWSNWYFSGNALLTFKNNNTPLLQRDFITPTNNQISYRNNSYGATAYSDPTTGEMKFLISGGIAYDKNYNLINASTSLKTCLGDKFAYHIIPFQNDPNKFYIIQFQSIYSDLLAAKTGLQVRCPNGIGLGYSIFDLSLNNGLGGFTTMNNVLLPSTSDGITLVRHANGKDVWVVVHSWGDNKFRAFLFTDGQVYPPVISAIGPVVNTTSPAVTGNIISTHNGKKIAAQIAENPFIELYDFDNTNGILSNYSTLNIPSAANRMIFSPDDSKLYFLGAYWTPGVYQFDFDALDVQNSYIKIAEDPYTSFRDMQLGLDGKIYIGQLSYFNSNTFQYDYYLPIINCPNLPKFACNYKEKGLNTQYLHAQFPNFINDFITQPKGPRVKEFSLGNDTAICFGDFKLSAPEGWQNYRWNTGETTREINITTPGLYYVLAGDEGFSCPTAFGSIKISNASKTLNLGNDTILCPKTLYTLKVPENFKNLLWNDNTTVHNKSITKSGTYTLIAQDENGCTNWDTATVSIKVDPMADFGNDTTLCLGQSLLLQLLPQANPFQKAEYLWQNGSIKDTFRITKQGTYWGQATYQGCTTRDTINVNYISAQQVNLGNDTTLCVGDTLQLSTNISNANYIWSTGETTSSIKVNQSGIYWIKVNNGNCTVTDTINIHFQNKPEIALGKDTVLCEKEKLTLSAINTGATYLWQDGSKLSTYDVYQEGLYKVKVTVNGCSNTDSLTVTYKPLPIINLGNNFNICAGSSALLNAYHSSIKSYTWQDGSSQPTFLVNSLGNYKVNVTGVNGCNNQGSVYATVMPLPEFSLGKDTILCEQQQLQLNVSLSNASYLWNTGDVKNSIIIKQPGTYWLEAKQSGCSKRDSITVNYKPLPSVFIGNDTTLCEGITKILDAGNAGASFKWQDMSSLSTFQVNKAGSYHVAVNLDGCIQRDTIQVFYKSKPVFTLGRDTVLCTGQELTLTPNISNATLLWQNGSSSPSLKVNDIGTYKVTARNECGNFTDEISITKGVCALYLPNAFTPNNDGLNDLFRIKDPGFIKTLQLTIYNRWGQLIFKTDDPYKGWDGKFNGVDQPEGNYVWQINITTKEGVDAYKRGNVILIR